jgi:UDP-N-acetyl-D-glucosamine dehydrogenase
MPDRSEALLAAIAARRARVGVLGLGYAGLPVARAFASRGFAVLGFDTDPDKVARLRRGESCLGHFPAAAVRAMRASGFEATDQMERLGEADALLLCVPTPLGDAREPDLRFVTGSAGACAARLRPGQLVVLESTTYPGTTREVVLPVLARSGLVCGRDFFLAYSPEREDPGNPEHGLGNTPKVVGAVDPASLEVAAALYGQIAARVVRVSSAEAAEATKILENTYRAVNIALVNELKVIYDKMGIDVWEVIDAARTKPFGFQAFYPGPGLGGHCIPIDPFYLTWAARRYGVNTRFIELAGEVNTAMPAYVVGKVTEALNDRGKAVKGSRVLLLGMAYKRDIDDCRESPGLALMDLLGRRGAAVGYNDPHVPRLPATRRYPQWQGAESRVLTAEELAAQDCVVVVTDHSAYDWEWIVGHAALVVDTRNATRGVQDHRERIVSA